jgi:thiamine-phosphate diphosphorylase
VKASSGRSECPRLTFVTDRRRSRISLPEIVDAACKGGADAIQLREPDLDDEDIHQLAPTLAEICAGKALLVVNNRPSIAAEVGAGLHLPEAADVVRPWTFPFVSRAVHSAETGARARGCDALVAGHVFASASKPGKPPLTLSGLRTIIMATRLPVIAIGGIDAGNAAAAVAAGARGVAVISSIANADNPEAATRLIREVIDEALDSRREQEDTV